MLNLPLGDDVAIRVVGFSARDAGFIDNVLGESLGGTFDNADFVDEDVNDVEYMGGRAAVRWLPNENWTVDAGVVYQQMDGEQLRGRQRPAFGPRELAVVRFVDESRDDEWTQLALTLQGDLGLRPVHLGDQLLHAPHLLLPGQHGLHLLSRAAALGATYVQYNLGAGSGRPRLERRTMRTASRRNSGSRARRKR